MGKEMTETSSMSPISGRNYSIPNKGSKDQLASFIEKNRDKKVVAVQGLGFVGTVMSLVIANSEKDEYAVIGVDKASAQSYWKIGDINAGICPVVSSDPLVSKFFNFANERKNFFATHHEEAFAFADVIVIDINLDVTKVKDEKGRLEAYDVPMDGFRDAVKAIATVCKEDVLILVETTVPPGTCRQVIYPILVQHLQNRGFATDKFKLGHSYERVMPGPNYVNSIKNYFRVYSGINDQSADAVESFLKTVISTDEFPLTRLKTTESTEMAKVLENSYRAMNISFVIEWSRFAESAGVDLYEVINAIRLRPTHANLMYPGIGVGGYCLTKDPLMASWSSENIFGIDAGLGSSVKAVENNDMMPMYCYEFVIKILKDFDRKVTRIGLLGVAYGPGIADTRFSPVEDFYNRLAAKFDKIQCHDPYVTTWCELNLKIETSLATFLSEGFDILIVTTAHSSYTDGDEIYKYLEAAANEITVIDTVGLLDFNKLPSNYKRNKNFFVLGVGHNEG